VFTMGSSFHDLGGDRTSAIPSIQHEMTVVQGTGIEHLPMGLESDRSGWLSAVEDFAGLRFPLVDFVAKR
jgi:hypothetical protein